MKQIFGKGLFIRNDEEGKPCRIGDVVRVTYDNWQFNDDVEEWKNFGELSSIGTLCLLKSRGVRIRCSNGGYVAPNITIPGKANWKWELIKSNND